MPCLHNWSVQKILNHYKSNTKLGWHRTIWKPALQHDIINNNTLLMHWISLSMIHIGSKHSTCWIHKAISTNKLEVGGWGIIVQVLNTQLATLHNALSLSLLLSVSVIVRFCRISDSQKRPDSRPMPEDSNPYASPVTWLVLQMKLRYGKLPCSAQNH